MDFPLQVLSPVFVKILGYFVIKSIWKAWPQIKLWITWKGESFHNLSINSLNIWFFPVVKLQGTLLAQVQWIHAQNFLRRGIVTIADFFSRKTQD